jgi:benzoyl-CoA reductase/2-hydroxyglutaryl-CoA dehydratase subunit BcrC/BadD/HgdB
MVTLAGTQEAVQFYKDVAGEVKRRVKLKMGANERHRLIWDLFPPWHDMKLWKEFDKEEAVFVIDFYADAFSGRLTDPDPYMSLVNKYLFNPTAQRGVAAKRKTIEKFVKEYSLDGAVFMSNRSCRYFSLGQLDIASHLRKNFNLPVLSFESDHMDEKKHDKNSAVSQIQTFLSILPNGK